MNGKRSTPSKQGRGGATSAGATRLFHRFAALLLLWLACSVQAFRPASTRPSASSRLFFGHRIEYSANFDRHVVRRHDETIVESFLWLEDSLERYPDAQLQPVSYSTILCGVGRLEPQYPRRATQTNVTKLEMVLRQLLLWSPSQADHLLQHWPALYNYSVSDLEERFRFLLQPCPNSTVLQQANVSDDVDWVTLYAQGYGAGMGVAQISHALQIGDPMLLRQHEHSQTASLSTMGELLQQTPALNLQMTKSVLDLWVSGVSSLDTFTLAFWTWEGWDWSSCRIFLHAFHGCQSCTLEPGWNLHDNVRPSLLPESLKLLQTRLRLRPWQIEALFKTYSRLTTYRAGTIERKLDFLQEQILLPSKDLKSLILLQPSLLGMATESIDARIAFWRHLGLTVPQLRGVVLAKPAVLQYSVQKNLQPKLAFYTSLDISKTSLVYMTTRTPQMWGLSIETNLLPKVEQFCSACGDMKRSVFGRLVAQVPALLLYNINNLLAKLTFLQQELVLTSDELQDMIQRNPRVLLQSVDTSLKRKLALLRQYSPQGYRRQVFQHPTLLVIQVTTLEMRLQKEKLFLPNRVRQSKQVWLLKSNEVEREFVGASKASEFAGISVSNMYSALKRGRPVNGLQFVYADESSTSTSSVAPAASTPATTLEEQTQDMLLSNENGKDIDPDKVFDLIICTTGRAFPPEDTIRGRRRTGGHALQIGNWTSTEWKDVCSNIFSGRQLRLLPGGLLLISYPYIRPSRRRCSLYTCWEALRIALEWQKRKQKGPSRISIHTDSYYVAELLGNSTSLLRWGSASHRENFHFDGAGRLHEANVDILYPLVRTYCNLLMRNVTVDISRETLDSRLSDGAKLAARLTYFRTK